MPNWNDIYNEQNEAINHAQIQVTNAPYELRKKYLENLHKLTGRNIICYYSSWLSKPGANLTEVNDSDMEGFMNAAHRLDRSLGLDLFLHTPGGSVTATEGIVNYLRSIFGDNIRVVVPQLAMSAGTMIACAGKEIIMGKQSSLGPIDPQFGSLSALNIIHEYDEFEKDISINPGRAMYWSIRLQQLPPAIIQDCKNAVKLSEELVTQWLTTGMFEGDKDASAKTKKIVDNLNENESSKVHGRHLNKNRCKEIGLKILELESDNTLQDAVLSVHHTYSILLSNSPIVKIIENQNGSAIIRNAGA
jgi:hypothetical protein